jgi:hypothetical protein
MATKKVKATPTAKGKTVRNIRTIKQLPAVVWFELDLAGIGLDDEDRVSVRFAYGKDEPTICFDSHYSNFAVAEILELAEVVKVLPKLKLVSMC